MRVIHAKNYNNVEEIEALLQQIIGGAGQRWLI